LEMMNQTVPFLNGGLFECLDDKTQNLYIDGFSDQMTKGEKLIVPDYLFFGIEEKVDLSTEYGAKNKAAKEAAVKGLINILKSYKFTITENTPIEEDVALDPELLGKVFENLLASYNPETKTTARKQTGSFYTPREIVNYMVDESLIAYLKNNILNEDEVYQEMGATQTNLLGNVGKVGQLGLNDKIGRSKYGGTTEQLDKDLHQLFSFDTINPFAKNEGLQKQIIKALDKCTILDPACGSGAFPMGALQKMVHVLHKVDPNGQEWKQRQIDKVNNAIERLEEIEDSQIREQSIKDLELQKQDIEDAFENNELDYGRKLFLIENCIYGVDIQSIATQISKLRFFISLVVDQKINPNKENFGIRPLPNLETKFVAANTLVGIDKPSNQLSLYDTKEVKALEKELKIIRHKLFSAKTKDTKLKYRQKDEDLRNAIAAELIKSDWANDTAEKLASWDPYDQNASSSFFDPEWMFDMKNGFDVVIGNPPYIQIKDIPEKDKPYYVKNYVFATGRFNIFYFFIENSKRYSSESGITSYIVPDRILLNTQTVAIREWLITNQELINITSFDESVFDSAVVDSVILTYKNHINKSNEISANPNISIKFLIDSIPIKIPLDYFKSSSNKQFDLNYSPLVYSILKKIKANTEKLGNISDTKDGVIQSKIPDMLFLQEEINSDCKPLLFGKNVNKFSLNYSNDWIHYDIPLMKKYESERNGGGLRMRVPLIFERTKILTRQTADRIIGTIDKDNYYYSNTLHGTAITNSKYAIEFVLAILNSSLMSFYYRATTAEGGKVFAQVKIELLRQLPIKYTKSQNVFISLVQMLFFLNVNETSNKVKLLAQVIDSAIFELYFTTHMQEKEIDVIPLIEKDIEAEIQGGDFEKLNDTEKEEVIEHLHKTWSHPDNEVRNRIKLFAVRSPDILKPILES